MLPTFGRLRPNEPRIDDIKALADTLALELRPLPRPLAFYGHNVGAVVVAEMKLLGGTNSRLPADPEILDMVLPGNRLQITVRTGADDPHTFPGGHFFLEAQPPACWTRSPRPVEHEYAVAR